jgi:hypothetical protein
VTSYKVIPPETESNSSSLSSSSINSALCELLLLSSMLMTGLLFMFEFLSSQSF